MSQAIIRTVLDFDSSQEENFKSITEHEVVRNKRVKAMNKTMVGAVTPEYGLDLEYIVPATGERDFSKVSGAVVKIYYEGGSTRTYRGVTIEKEGERKTDGDNELVQNYSFIAISRDPA